MAATLNSPIDAVTLADVGGHVDALGLLTLTDTSGQPRDDITVGIQEPFDSASPEPLRLEAADLDPLAGSLVVDYIEGVTVSQWAALAATGEQPHRGRWRVFAQIEVEANANSDIDSLIRLTYRSGNGPLAQTDRPAVTPHRAGELIEVDLGVANIREAEDSHSWYARVEIKGATTGLDVRLRELLFVPADRYARARAPQKAPALTGIVGYDTLGEVTGALDGETAPLGGDWDRVAGDTDDFMGADGYVFRSATSDDAIGSSGLLGVLARLGTGVAAQTDVRVELETPMPSTEWSLYGGVFARYVDANNWLMALRVSARWGNGAQRTMIFLYKCVAGTLTPVNINVLNYAAGWHTLALGVLANGAALVFMGPQGAQGNQLAWVAGTGPDADLATGGALDDGGWGIVCGPVPTAEPLLGCNFRNFTVSEGEDVDHALYPNQSLRLTHAKAEREDAAGTSWGDVPSFTGRRLLIPPATRNENTSRLVVKQAVNDLTSLPAAPVNLCSNPDAATDTTGWTNASLTTFERVTSPPAGLPSRITTAFHAVGNQGNDHARDEIAVESGKVYRFSAYVLLDTATATGITLQIANAVDTNKAQTATFLTGDTWTRISVSVTADATETWRFKVRQVAAGDTDYYFTGVLIEEVPSLSATLTVQPRVLLTS